MSRPVRPSEKETKSKYAVSSHFLDTDLWGFWFCCCFKFLVETTMIRRTEYLKSSLVLLLKEGRARRADGETQAFPEDTIFQTPDN